VARSSGDGEFGINGGFCATVGFLNATVFPATISFEEESSEEIYLCIEASRKEITACPQTLVACMQNPACPSSWVCP
jgi:hypothetical protein